ncbi:diguanylate cyclase [Pleomorphomonas sp. NRK KF1]|uniref:GGDEF domain-containing protein n=1 Tax=Pleomorphomonas sp. NRK KF1 TaxID=2943000 RepID=UPI0020442B13|nr:sensor domain-containing diguanylate cyclase [Pleomorphomonas sp. NRK KF1]MCM5552568.1 sensor domain-containing diguanylate cyclase [Pleomorphomonas sp. NRK KF1]
MTAKLDRMRMIPLIGAILAIGFLITNMVSYLIAVDTVRQSIVETELPLTGSNIYSEIQTDLVRPILVSSLMANDTFVQDWLHSGELDLGAITRYLQRIQRQYNTFTAFLVSRDTQAYYHFQAPPRHLKRDDPADIWFFRSIDAAAPYEVNVDINKQQNDALTVFINYRVVDHDGKMIALAGVGLDFRTVRNIVARYRDQFDRNIYFVNARGDIVVATDADTPVGASIRKSEGLDAVADHILREESGEYSFKRDGRTILLSHRLIPDLGWRVMVEQDEAAAMRPLWLGFLFNLAIGFVVIVVSLVLVSLAFGIYKKRIGDVAFRDALTGLVNRAGFEAEFDARTSSRRPPPGPLSLVLIDLDAFSVFNDRFGRAAGDAALGKIGRIVSEVASGVGVVARLDGDDFAILRDGSSDAATRFADSLVKVIGAETFGDGVPAQLTASVGVTPLAEGEGRGAAMERVERALRKAKAAGGDRVCLA